jgi:hypothetical protein
MKGSDPVSPRSRNRRQVIFGDYLKRAVSGNNPPVSIRARDLDTNFAVSTIIEHPEKKNSYRVDYRREGTVIDIVTVPPGINKGDLLYWDPQQGEEGAWVVLPAPSDNSLRVLTLESGVLAWTATEECS